MGRVWKKVGFGRGRVYPNSQKSSSGMSGIGKVGFGREAKNRPKLKTLNRTHLFIQEKSEEQLNETEFITFYYSLFQKKELDEIFIKYATNSSEGVRMSVDNLIQFFKVNYSK